MTGDEFNELLAKLQAEAERPTLSNRLYWRGQRLEEAFVSGDAQARRTVYLWRLLSLPLVLGLCVALPFTYRDAPLWLYLVVYMPLVGLCTLGCSLRWWRASAYRNGWLAGRRDLYAAWEESERRGLTAREFYYSMLEKDFQVHF